MPNMTIRARGGRILDGWAAWTVYLVGIAFTAFQVYFVTIGTLPPFIFRAFHLSFCLVLLFLVTPAGSKSPKKGVSAMDVFLALGAAAVLGYILIEQEGIQIRTGVSPTLADTLFGILTVLLVLEAARRYFGPVLPVVSLCFLMYALFGSMLPGVLKIPRYSVERVISYVFSTNGIYGSALATSATFVYLFVFFGEVLVATGVGKVFMDLATALTGRVRGGPAKVSVLSSALFGTISGSASSNVVTTGAFTIPLMEKTGYRPHYASAVETAASIGGLFLPPVMGAGGFLMAEILHIPYAEVCKAAAIPALLYYFALFLLVDLEAAKLKLKGMAADAVPSLVRVLKTGAISLVPIAVLLYSLLVAKNSPLRAALWSIVACIVVSFLSPDPENRMTPKRLINVMSLTARKALNVSAATGCAGIIVGIVSMTGLGLTFSSLLMGLAQNSIMLSLIMAMVISIILGMGLPITATYITAAAILAPALVRLGLQPVAVHLFLYFYSAVSGMTPPVCVTAFAAAGLNGSDPMQVGWTAVKLGWVAYVIPYMFILGPALLMNGPTALIVESVLSAVVGVIAIASAIYGMLLTRELTLLSRVLLGVAGLFLLDVGRVSNVAGFVIALAVTAMVWLMPQRKSTVQGA